MTLNQLLAVTPIKVSSTGKMPCFSWSLQAIETCPGSIDPITKLLVDACRGCYATDGHYLGPTVKAPRAHNKIDWQRAAWADDMVALLTAGKGQRHFRWFDSGDCYHIKLARKILDVMTRTPNCMHWLPTRMHKFTKFTAVFDAMNELPNVVVRYSSDSIKGATVAGRYTSTIIEHADDATTATVCEAYSRAGKCKDCRACWNKSVSTIAYPQHGRKMARINLELVA